MKIAIIGDGMIKAEPTSIEGLFQESVYVCIHSGLTKETEGIIGEKLISLMKLTSYLIDAAKAGLIDENALCKALREERISGAVLDCFWDGPLDKNRILTKLYNVIFTSHLAETTIESLTHSSEMLEVTTGYWSFSCLNSFVPGLFSARFHGSKFRYGAVVQSSLFSNVAYSTIH